MKKPELSLDDKLTILINNESHIKWSEITDLIDNGADPHILNNIVIKKICYLGAIGAFNYLIEKINLNIDDDLRERLLNQASTKGHIEIVKYFVENGVNVHNRNGETAMRAALKGHIEIVKYLIDSGVKVESILLNKNHSFKENIESNTKEWLINYKEKRDLNNSLNKSLNINKNTAKKKKI